VSYERQEKGEGLRAQGSGRRVEEPDRGVRHVSEEWRAENRRATEVLTYAPGSCERQQIFLKELFCGVKNSLNFAAR